MPVPFPYPSLTTARLQLSPLGAASTDEAEVFAILADDTVTCQMSIPNPLSYKSFKGYYDYVQGQMQTGEALLWSIRASSPASSELFGLVQYERLATAGAWSLGFLLKVEQQRKGLILEAVEQTNKHLFTTQGATCLHLSHFIGHTASAAVLSKMGATHLGVFEKEYQIKGQTHEERWELTKDRWQAHTNAAQMR